MKLSREEGTICIVMTTGDLGVFACHFVLIGEALLDGPFKYWWIAEALLLLAFSSETLELLLFFTGNKDFLGSNSSLAFQDICSRSFPHQWIDYEHIFCDLNDLKEWRLEKGDLQWKAYIYYYFSLMATYISFSIAILLGSAQRLLPSKSDL